VTTAEFIASQRACLETALQRYARPGDRYALLGFPDYPNVGDSAIWLGARAVLQCLTGRPPVQVCGGRRGGLIGLEGRLGSGTIYIIGGGNFGDLWPGAQRYREKLLARFPNNRIVQLPQSIHFESDEAVQRCAEAIRRHGDFHLMARDDASQSIAKEHFRCTVALAPDCAFGLGPLWSARDPHLDVYCLLRSDKERLPADRSAIHALRPCVEDWLWENPRPINRLRRAVLLDRIFGGGCARTRLFDRIAGVRLQRGVRMLSSGRQAITDRLHGHILCLLLDIPHVALDNSYGKIGAYCRTWGDGGQDSRFALHPESAVATLAELRNCPPGGLAGVRAAEDNGRHAARREPASSSDQIGTPVSGCHS
jgi:pyruvyl transferase EpsO